MIRNWLQSVRRRAGVVQGIEDRSPQPHDRRLVDSDLVGVGGVWNIGSLARVFERLEFVDPSAFTSAPRALDGGEWRPSVLATTGSRGLAYVSPMHPVPVGSSQVIARQRLVAAVPNYCYYFPITAGNILHYFLSRRLGPNPSSVTSGVWDSEMHANGLLLKSPGAFVFAPEPRPVYWYDWFVWDFRFFQEITRDRFTAAIYAPMNPEQDMTFDMATGFLGNTVAFVVDLLGSPSSTDIWGRSIRTFLVAQYRGGSIAGAPHIIGNTNIPQLTGLASEIGEWLGRDRAYREFGGLCYLYTGGHYKHYRLIVQTPSVPITRGAFAGFAANLYGAFGSPARTESHAQVPGDPRITVASDRIAPIESPIGSAVNVVQHTTALKDLQTYVLDFNQHDYRGVEYVAIDLRAMNLGGALINPFCTARSADHSLPSYPHPESVSNETTLPTRQVADWIGGPRDPEYPYDPSRFCSPLDWVDHSDEENRRRMANAVYGVWSNLDVEVIGSFPELPTTVNYDDQNANLNFPQAPNVNPFYYVVKAPVQVSANVYLVGIND